MQMNIITSNRFSQSSYLEIMVYMTLWDFEPDHATSKVNGTLVLLLLLKENNQQSKGHNKFRKLATTNKPKNITNSENSVHKTSTSDKPNLAKSLERSKIFSKTD